MPLQLNDKDVVSKMDGIRSALIVPCNMCPAVSIAIRENKPFMQFYKSLFKSPPFQKHIKRLQAQLKAQGIRSQVFKTHLYHHWFICMWPGRPGKKLKQTAKQYEAIIVLGCDSASEIVRNLVKATDCHIFSGMEIAGIINARLRFQLPGKLFFDNCQTIKVSNQSISGH